MWNRKPNAHWHVNFPLFSASHRPVWCRNLEIQHDFLGFSLKKSRFLDRAFIHLNISTFHFFPLLTIFNYNRPCSHTCYFKKEAGSENLINGRNTAQNYKLLCDQTARIWAESLGDDFSDAWCDEHNTSTMTLVSFPVVAFIALSSVALTYLREVFAQHSDVSSPRRAASTLLFIYTFSRATLASTRSRQLMNLLAFAGSRGRCLSL